MNAVSLISGIPGVRRVLPRVHEAFEAQISAFPRQSDRYRRAKRFGEEHSVEGNIGLSRPASAL